MNVVHIVFVKRFRSYMYNSNYTDQFCLFNSAKIEKNSFHWTRTVRSRGNFNNVDFYQGPKNAMRYYIACQAPMESTITDFWRMIWEQQCKVVIMLTDLVENGVEKCTEYIPPSEITDCHRLYGDYQVTLKKRETKEKYAISTLHLKVRDNFFQLRKKIRINKNLIERLDTR